jgi:hypothetical protein
MDYFKPHCGAPQKSRTHFYTAINHSGKMGEYQLFYHLIYFITSQLPVLLVNKNGWLLKSN